MGQEGEGRGGGEERSHISETCVTQSRGTKSVQRKNATPGQEGGAVAGKSGGFPYATPFFIIDTLLLS